MSMTNRAPARRLASRLAVCAHELRGALTVIAGYTELLRRDAQADERERRSTASSARSRRADALLADALAGTRVGALRTPSESDLAAARRAGRGRPARGHRARGRV